MRIAITGRPGVGKTTVCLKVFERVKSADGFVTLEVREKGQRIGFKIKSLQSGKEVWLAKVGEGKYKVGKYAVFVENLDKFLEDEKFEAEILIVDEIGPMELKSKKFVEFVEKEVLTRKKVLVSVHYKSTHPLAEKVRREFKLFTVDEENRGKLVDEIVKLW
ncbi:MAG: NTPase [Archaeoglobaceae archaeon]|nr:NTPase [Archaeoglobaceae archaeon]MCX8152090.1 NTPase [Archaeoglobaceae archaeon]MDW8013525.1 NTPase [Archaeoglobaceae archaeon]